VKLGCKIRSLRALGNECVMTPRAMWLSVLHGCSAVHETLLQEVPLGRTDETLLQEVSLGRTDETRL